MYEPCQACGGHTISNASKPISAKLDKEAQRIAKGLHAGTFNGKIDPAMTGMVAEHLTEGVIKGFAKDFVKIDFNTPDGKMLAKLEKNVYSFSAAKNYSQLKEMTKALIDDTGLIRSLPDFKKQVAAISKIHNHAWLQTEYNTALNGASMAARWNEFEDNADIMPFLQYSTVGDDRVREDHVSLDGVTRRIDDEFWNTWYPPNGFNCRCTVDQQTTGTETKVIKYPEKVTPMFATNLAKNGLVFPKGHSYFIKAPKAVIKQGEKMAPNQPKTKTKKPKSK